MAWAARCALVCVQKSTHTQLREESYAQYHSHKYIVYINIYATTYINQDSVSDTQQRKRSTKNQACKRNVALPSHSPQFNSPTHPPLRYIENGRRETIKEESFEHRGKWLCARPLTTVRLSHPPAPNCGTNDRCRRAPCLGLWAAGMAMMGPTYSGGLCALMLPCVASAGMAMTWPTYDGGLCSTMLLCLVVAGMATTWPNYDGGLCSTMLLCLASAGMVMIGPTYADGLCALMLLCLLVRAWR